MKRIASVATLMLALVSILVLAAGCGGGGGAGLTVAPNSPSPYAGAWSGLFTDTTNSQSGTLVASISTSGRLTGTMVNQTLNSRANVSGTVQNDGSVVLTVVFPTGALSAEGTVVLGLPAQMTGTLSVSRQGQPYGQWALTLTRQ